MTTLREEREEQDASPLAVLPDDATGPDGSPPSDLPRRRRRRWLWLVAGGVLLAAGLGTWWWTTDGSTEPAAAGAAPAATAVVERGTITATSSWDGTLGYAARVTADSPTAGVVTRLAEQGDTVEPGAVLYRLNERPVVLLRGAVPMYRDLAPGTSGIDVEQLESNLTQLGYGRMPVDDRYTPDTAEAVRAWQAAIGTAVTGVVARRDVVFVPEGRKVDALHVAVGDLVAPGTPVLDVTSAEKAVGAEVDLDDRELVEIGTEVRVVVAEGEEVPGTVTSATVVQAPSGPGADTSGGEGAAAETASAVRVEVRLGEDVPDDLVGARVEVVVAIDERSDVLLVPVNALLALAEGGYGLEVVHDDGTTSVVPVTTGLFAAGKVQVEGDGIGEGTVVGVAGR